MIKIVGYEGVRREYHACTYGAAAVMSADGRLYNSCLPNGGYKNGQEVLDGFVSSGIITLLERPIEIEDNTDPMFVFDLPVEYIDREPYNCGEYDEIMYGWLGKSRGATRGYQLFTSMERLHKWLVSLHIGRSFMLEPYNKK